MSLAKKGTKKLVLKNFKVPAKAQTQATSDKWNELEPAVLAIYQQKPVARPLQQLCDAVQTVCVTNNAKSLYDKLKSAVESHLKGEHTRITTMQLDSRDEFLDIVHTLWSNYSRQSQLLRNVFIYLDQTYAHGTAMPLWSMSLHLLSVVFFQDQHFHDRLISSLVDSVTSDRRGETVDTGRLAELCRMLTALNLFKTSFQPALLEATAAFYAAETAQNIQSMPITDYLDYCTRRYTEETERLRTVLTNELRKPLMMQLDKHLLEDNLPVILSQGFEALFVQDDIDHLAVLYKFCDRISALARLKTAFSTFIKKIGYDCVKTPAKDKAMVDELLKFKAKTSAFVTKAFAADTAFASAEKDAFNTFINRRANKPAEMIAKFLDTKLRTGYKECSEAELDEVMDKVLVLFRFVNGKDVFEAFYKTHLAKRLLYNKMASTDLEMAMLRKLKQECGSNFTSNLEGMFKDMTTSTELSQEYKSTTPDISMELTVNVLTQSFWPTYPPVKVLLPPQLVAAQESFGQFYCKKHQNRRLSWYNAQGSCFIAANFPKGKKDLSLSLYQAVVLLRFNDHRVETCEQLQEATGIDMVQLKLTLQSLALGKFRVLRKSSSGKEVASSDKFMVNEKFHTPLKRIKINQIQLRETAEEADATNEKVFQDRVFAIDAAIVRVMKTRKTLKHSALMSELFSYLKFPVKATDIKKRIEALIDRDYLERDASDSGVFNYLA
eukprot:m.8687 g.8687  ORF g.8687 m.8687 type:complete len:722 (-) comp5384_c0_seq1:63-2228(-)